MSATLGYLKDLPLSAAYIDVLNKMNLKWETLDALTLTDEQFTDFLTNYFGFVSMLFDNPTYKQQYTVCLRYRLNFKYYFSH